MWPGGVSWGKYPRLKDWKEERHDFIYDPPSRDRVEDLIDIL